MGQEDKDKYPLESDWFVDFLNALHWGAMDCLDSIVHLIRRCLGKKD